MENKSSNKIEKNNEQLKILRHSAAHLTAQAILECFPGTLLTIGPATESGFFYDILPKENLKLSALKIIAEKMQAIVAQNLKITHKMIPKAEAKELFKNNPFKLELLASIEADTVGLAQQGNFYDLCKGGHVESTALLKNTILTGLSGSYWRAEKTNQPLQRISGTAFFTTEELNYYLQQKSDALEFDHRKIGKELDLFSFHDEGLGFPFFHPKGKIILNVLKNFLRKIWLKNNYLELQTPSLLSSELWQRSGHYAHYKNNMYFSNKEEKEYAIKPMNCPGAILVFKNKPRSYKELPLKLAEFGAVHRFELSGVLHGLFRVRAFTIDDTHIFCEIKNIEQEIINCLKIIEQILSQFNFSNIKFAVSTRPESFIGNIELWDQATAALINALKSCNKEFKINIGEGAFYGPKIEVVIKDSMEREWQCSTLQIDFFQIKNFNCTFIDSNGQKNDQFVIIHQATYGSLERFFGILLEHYKGKLPLWLAPVQIEIIPITSSELQAATILEEKLSKENLRVTINKDSEPLSAKIKATQLLKIPCTIIIGKKEALSNTFTLRYLDGVQKQNLNFEELLKLVKII